MVTISNKSDPPKKGFLLYQGFVWLEVFMAVQPNAQSSKL
jgi:hypothetical protein